MPGHILIVEDDKLLTEAVSEVLRNAGYQTTVCTNYSNVTKCLGGSLPVDLVLLDGYLHEFDGRHLLRQLKSDTRFQHIPVVFASIMLPNDLEGYQPDAVLPKPYGMYSLIKTIKEQLNEA